MVVGGYLSGDVCAGLSAMMFAKCYLGLLYSRVPALRMDIRFGIASGGGAWDGMVFMLLFFSSLGR